MVCRFLIDGEDEYYEYSQHTSTTVRDFIGAELDDEWGISEMLAVYEEERKNMIFRSADLTLNRGCTEETETKEEFGRRLSRWCGELGNETLMAKHNYGDVTGKCDMHYKFWSSAQDKPVIWPCNVKIVLTN